MYFDWERHVRYFSSSLRELPGAYSKLDTNRLTIVHFAIQALDMLHIWELSDEALLEKYALNRQEIIDWVYSLQVTSFDDETGLLVGFKGGSFLGNSTTSEYNCGHIAMTYTAIASLKTLRDDLERIDKNGIVKALKSLQLDDGSFKSLAFGSENDMRFLYCACSMCYMLNDWSAINIPKAVDYIRSCHSWDGAFGLIPGQEGHGGSTFCAVASIILLNKIEEILDDDDDCWRDDLIHWCTSRQVGGMQGRPGKLEDTCYSYWIGATLCLIGKSDLLDHSALRTFVLRCQSHLGGFGKAEGAFPDMLHSFYSLSYLNFSQINFTEGDNNILLKEMNCTLGICQDAATSFGQPYFP